MILGVALILAGKGHLTTSRLTFRAQVPTLLKDYADFVVLASGVVEILLGLGLVVLWKYRVQMGVLAAAFFSAIFWGNISQYLNHTDAFGLNSDRARFIRLLFQPLLVMWALGSTGAWSAWRSRVKP
ncbi:COG4270 Predicted membrane protein [Candidatus Nanopelagicaceae bacterium]